MLHDISPMLDESLPVWPGDHPFRREWSGEVTPGGGGYRSSFLKLSAHTGSHVDAPLHTMAGGASMEECGLSIFIGPARVVAAQALDGEGRVLAEPVHAALRSAPPRVLFRTDSFTFEKPYGEQRFAGLSPEVVSLLAGHGVFLAGIDTPSVDPLADHELQCHRLLNRAGILILEGLVLSAVPPGDYELFALPLRIRGGDASPVRAVLRPLAT